MGNDKGVGGGLPFGEVHLFPHLHHDVPLAVANDGGRDELRPDVGFGKGFLVHCELEFVSTGFEIFRVAKPGL